MLMMTSIYNDNGDNQEQFHLANNDNNNENCVCCGIVRTTTTRADTQTHALVRAYVCPCLRGAVRALCIHMCASK